MCLNGHEWAKRQAQRRRLRFTALDNGFLDAATPAVLQALRPSAADIEAFFQRWLAPVPLPLTRQDRAAGFAYHLSILQMEVSRTQVFARPLRGREFFEEVLRDQLDLGRPTRLQLLFPWKITRATTRSMPRRRRSSRRPRLPPNISDTFVQIPALQDG